MPLIAKKINAIHPIHFKFVVQKILTGNHEEQLSKLVHQREPPLYIIRAVTLYPTKANLMKKIGGHVSIHTATTNWIPPGLQSCPKKGKEKKKSNQINGTAHGKKSTAWKDQAASTSLKKGKREHHRDTSEDWYNWPSEEKARFLMRATN